MRISDWSSDVCSSDLDGAVLTISAIPNGIGSPKTRKWHRLIRPWINHLVACANGLSMTTALVASDDSLLLAPFEEHVARRLLGDLLQAWQPGMQLGRASCRERVCQYVWISGVAVSFKKK